MARPWLDSAWTPRPSSLRAAEGAHTLAIAIPFLFSLAWKNFAASAVIHTG